MNDTIAQTNFLIFRTSVQDRYGLSRLSRALDNWPNVKDWSIDLEDWEKVLRIECVDLNPLQIKLKLRKLDIHAQQMPIW